MNIAGHRTFKRHRVTACAVIMGLVVAGCGNKGGLVLPEEPPAQSQDEATPSKGAGDQGATSDKSTRDPKG